MGRAVIPPAKLGHDLHRELVRRDWPPNKTDAAESPPRPRFSPCESILVARTAIKVMVVLGVLIGGSDVLKLIVSDSFLAFAFGAYSKVPGANCREAAGRTRQDS